MGKTKCTFSTSIAGTLTCSHDGEWDDMGLGFPKNKYPNYPCQKFKELNEACDKLDRERTVREITEDVLKDYCRYVCENDGCDCMFCRGKDLDNSRRCICGFIDTLYSHSNCRKKYLLHNPSRR